MILYVINEIDTLRATRYALCEDARYTKYMIKGILLAFGEIFLKSDSVQKELKEKLRQNIVLLLRKEKINFKIYCFRERIFIQANQVNKIINILKNIFGIAWIAKSVFFEKTDLKDVNNFVLKNYQNWIKPNASFALKIKKDDSIKNSAEQIIRVIAKNISRKVNLDKPQKTIFIEARKYGWFLYFQKQKCLEGLPVGSQGKVLSLISGGIDSPVASYLMAKRGAENVWAHFHSFPLVSKASIEKVKKLAIVFAKYQPKLKIYFITFSEIQKNLKINIPAKYLVLFYRKTMLKIAQTIAIKEKCRALITGESLGQVSSQTLPNINITQNGLKIPVLRPLIGYNKEEIIKLAQKIQTFEITIQPQEDCCTLFIPKHQTAEGKIEDVKKIEKKLDYVKLMKYKWEIMNNK